MAVGCDGSGTCAVTWNSTTVDPALTPVITTRSEPTPMARARICRMLPVNAFILSASSCSVAKSAFTANATVTGGGGGGGVTGGGGGGGVVMPMDNTYSLAVSLKL
jgi:hypothetical protein